ncbi:MAG: hypothetical protein WCG06_05125, partial [Candidatus Omnitrophota bacterium]
MRSSRIPKAKAMLPLTIGYLTLVCAWSASCVFLAQMRGQLTGSIVSIGLAVAAVLTTMSFYHGSRIASESRLRARRIPLWSRAVLVVFALFTLKSFFWLLYPKGNELFVGSPNNLGDIMLHGGLIHFFAAGPAFWPDNPIITNQKIMYPFGMDLFNGLLMKCGVDFLPGLVWTGLVGSTATAYALYKWGRGFTVAGFLFSGGLLGFLFFADLQIPKEMFEISWKNMALTVFVTQRNFLYALPAGLMLLCVWHRRWIAGRSGAQSATPLMPEWLTLLIYATMPLFHVHTFVFLSLLLAFWLCFLEGRRLDILRFILTAAPVAALLFYWISDGLRASSAIHLRWGWEQTGTEGLILYWIKNFGIFLPLCLWLFLKNFFTFEQERVRPRWRLDSKTAWIYPALLLFAVFYNLMMSSWGWDNIKLLLWPYLILLPFIWRDLIWPLKPPLKSAVLILLFFSGFLWLVGDLNYREGYSLIDPVEVAQIEAAVAPIPADARFVCHPTHNHPLIFLGRKVTLGYLGWITSHGLTLNDYDQSVDELLNGQDSWRRQAAVLNARYLFWGKLEEAAYPKSSKPWQTQSRIVAEGSWGKIY